MKTKKTIIFASLLFMAFNLNAQAYDRNSHTIRAVYTSKAKDTVQFIYCDPYCHPLVDEVYKLNKLRKRRDLEKLDVPGAVLKGTVGVAGSVVAGAAVGCIGAAFFTPFVGFVSGLYTFRESMEAVFSSDETNRKEQKRHVHVLNEDFITGKIMIVTGADQFAESLLRVLLSETYGISTPFGEILLQGTLQEPEKE
jgi:hypothetical protein